MTETGYARIIIDKKDEVIEKLEQENNRLLDVINNQDVKIADLENENKHLDAILTGEALVSNERKEQLEQAKEIIREIMKFDIPTLDYEKAEQFLKEHNK